MDNILIIQEAIHFMKNKQKNKTWIAIKVDMEKAYNRIMWKGVPTKKF